MPSANGPMSSNHYMSKQSVPFYPPRGGVAPTKHSGVPNDLAQSVMQLAQLVSLISFLTQLCIGADHATRCRPTST